MTNKPHYSGHRKRLKDKFDDAPSVLADYEILEILLGYSIPRKDVKPIAKDLITKSGSMANLFAADFSTVEGIGRETERYFRAIRELYCRIEKSRILDEESITSPAQVYRMLKYSIGFASNENFAVILLNSKSKIISTRILTEGIVNSAIVYPRQVAEYAISNKAVGVIAAHNHPTGDSAPSKKDIEFTKALYEALSTLGIKLRDHIIIGKDEYSSLYDLGYMSNY